MLAYANYALGRDLPRELPAPRERPPRLVYQGTLSTNGGHYDLRELFAAIAEQGISLDVYMARVVPRVPRDPGHPRPRHRCRRPRCCASSPTTTSAGRASTAGLNGAHLDTALPNKLYEYLGCGLPVITLPHRALRRMLGEEGVGIALDDVGELASALASADVVGLRRRVAERRERYTVESQIAGSRRSTTRSPRPTGAADRVSRRYGAPRLGELLGPRRVGAERGEPVLDAEVGGEERVVVA